MTDDPFFPAVCTAAAVLLLIGALSLIPVKPYDRDAPQRPLPHRFCNDRPADLFGPCTVVKEVP